MAGSDRALIEFEGVSRIYPGEPPVRAVDGVSFRLARGAFAALVGPSGSGKTTLLNLASGLDRPTEGRIRVGDVELTGLSPRELSLFRQRHAGFVFQAYNLFPTLSAVENVEYTRLVRGDAPAAARARAFEALDAVGLADKAHATPGRLSGGQQQRVAVARALASDPYLIFADEPTANLDSDTALKLIELLERINRERGTTFLFSTHDPRIVERVRERLRVRDGRLVAEGGA
jgi:putative ABC transport system ATP-binding protein